MFLSLIHTHAYKTCMRTHVHTRTHTPTLHTAGCQVHRFRQGAPVLDTKEARCSHLYGLLCRAGLTTSSTEHSCRAITVRAVLFTGLFLL